MIQKIPHEFINGIQLYIKRDDLIDSEIPGNKFYKLKYNILEAKKTLKSKLITFGGAYSNHILAVSYAGKRNNFQTYAFVRGEELKDKINENPNLLQANKNGMEFVFVEREEYRNKQKLITDFFNKYNQDDFYVIPEGGTNNFAVKGTQEMLNEETEEFDYICTAVGTGGTIAGLANAKLNHQILLGFPALKDSVFLNKEIKKYTLNEFELINDYHFGGFAKKNTDLINFILEFTNITKIPIEPVYTGKMIFGIYQEIQKGRFQKGSKILAIHTGGIENNTLNTYIK